MGGSGIDEDLLIAAVCFLFALGFVLLAVRFFRRRHVFLGLAAGAGAALFAVSAWFFAFFTIRMF